MSNRRGIHPLGAVRQKAKKYICGVCGEKARMTKAHVPPQCAGNSMLVPEYKLMSDGDVVSIGRQRLGGIHFLGHCRPCNSRIGERYDKSYGEFADILRPSWVKDWRIACPPKIEVPDGAFNPGKVIRSILLGMCALTPFMQQYHSDFVKKLMSGESVALPGDLKLYLALARGMSARVNGTVAGFYIGGPKQKRGVDGLPRGINAVASVYFPPLAWELVHDGTSIVGEDGWVDVSEWSERAPCETHQVSEFFTELPVVAHPQHTPGDHEYWIELFANDLAPFSECMNILNQNPDPLTRRAFEEKATISVEELEQLKRRRGY